MSAVVKVDIFVSGAGPVGLYFAYQMASLGHSVYCVDPKPGPTEQSRAVLITARTLEILERKRFVASILSEAVVLNGVRIFNQGTEIGQVDAEADTNYPHATVLAQGTTESILNQRLNQDTNCRVQWDTELVLYTQGEYGVNCTVRNTKTGKEQLVQSTYIVGADGTHSKVRKGNSDWTYEGNSIMTKFFLADLTVTGDDVDYLKDRFNAFLNGTYMMGLVRLNPLHGSSDQVYKYRVFGNTEAYELSTEDKKEIQHGLFKTEEPPTLEYVQNWLDKMAHPMKLQASNMDWSSYFKINERMANGYRRERAFLMGDAAHCHSPAGGQGMNLGLQDADNLAWKMSHVLKNLVSNPEELLDSYCIEREPLAKKTIQTTGSATKAAFSGSVFSYFRALLISIVLLIPQVKRSAFRNMMQLNVTVCNESKFIGTSDPGLIPVGHFLPDTGPLRKSYFPRGSNHLLQKAIERKSLRELLVDNDKFVAIFIDICSPATKPHEEEMELFWNLTRKFPIRRLVIRSSWNCHTANTFPSFVTSDEKDIAENSFYIEERNDLPMSVNNRIVSLPFYSSLIGDDPSPCSVLILRPDLYVANAKIVHDGFTLKQSLKFLEFIFPS